MRRSESKTAVAGFLLIVAVLVANAGVSYWNTDRLVKNDRLVTHTREVLETLEDVRANVAEAEASQRGYLITGRPAYLKTYDTAAAQDRRQLAELKRLTSDNAEQETRAVALEELVEGRLERLQHNIALRREGGFKAVEPVVGTDRGQHLMDRIRAQVGAMEDAEDKLLLIRADQSSRSFRAKIITNVVGTLLGIGVACLAFLFFHRTLAERRKAELRARAQAQRQTAIGELRQRALSNTDVDALMNRAVRLVAEVLDVPLVKLLELLPDDEAFLLRAGVGWQEGLVGRATVSAGLDSQAGYTLHSSRPVVVGDLTTHEPVIVDDMRTESRFSGPALLLDHGVLSGMSVIIYDRPERPFGVLGAHTRRPRSFTEEDAQFLQAIANVLAAAIQRCRAEDALRDSEKRFRALADSVPEIVWTSLPDGRCDYVNRRWLEFTGMTLEETEGFGWVSALHEEDVERSTDRWMRSMQTGEPFECEYRFRSKDGTYRWCLGRALPMRDEGDGIVKWFGNCMDIDEHKRMEETLKDADRRKDEFLAMLGHELRNPLTPINNAVELLRLKSPDDPEIQWCTDVIVHQTEQIVRLVDDLLDVSRIVHGKIQLEREPVELKTIVNRAVETCQPLVDAKRHELEIVLPGRPVWIEADAMRLVQVLENLLTNAVRYTDEGGHIRLTARRDGNEAVLSVRDTGVGIDPHMLPRIFELFSQAETPLVRARGGLGLGLKLVASLVEMHGGSVQATSDGPGTGSEFVVRLPAISPPAAEGTESRPPHAAKRSPGPQRVLLVDDHRPILDSLAMILRKKGHEVRTACDGQAALDAAPEFRPSIVLADLGLPGMDGFELAGRLRRQSACRDAVLVALTGFAHEDTLRRVLEAGFDRLLVKPPDLAELDALLASVNGNCSDRDPTVETKPALSADGERVSR